MAGKTFLHPDEHPQITEIWSKNKSRPDTSVSKVSKALSDILFARLSKIPNWQASEPIALGSWARGELSPGSDIDLLFVGDEAIVQKIVDHFNENGWPLRYRIPEDLSDWTKGVKDFDVLALLTAKGLTPEAEQKLETERLRLASDFKIRLRYWCKAVDHERIDREKRYDSIVNYLEPNLKYGPGGLRDLEQGLLFAKLRPQHFLNHSSVIEKLQRLKIFFLHIRQGLHLLGYQDVLVSQSQLELSQSMGFKSEVQFMSEVQKSLGEVSFLSDFMTQAVRANTQQLEMSTTPTGLSKAIQILTTSKSSERVIKEYQIRQSEIELPLKKNLARSLTKEVNSQMADKDLISLFRSRIFSRIFPDLDLIEGLVQHDQYHRFAADAHLLQVMREVLRARKKPKDLGALIADPIRKMSDFDWEVLFWAAFFHDLCKGRKGDHSLLGADLVKKQMIQFGFSLRLTVEVAWMVKEHLLMSQAAFRFNPRDPRTWKKLFVAGVKRERALRLGVFTALDIKGTNPEAWNPWKEKLLCELMANLSSSTAKGLLKFYEQAGVKKLKYDSEFIDQIDPRVLEGIAPQILAKDSLHLKGRKLSQKPLVVRAKSGEWWIRFHEVHDQEGLFLRFVQCLHKLGASIQEAYIQTSATHGVYDWFRVRSSSSKKSIEGHLAKTLSDEPAATNILGRFSVIDASPIDENETLISFRGKDHKGALLAAAGAIHQAGMPIIWAKVSTWGRQIDDVFSVRASEKQVAEFILTQTKSLVAGP